MFKSILRYRAGVYLPKPHALRRSIFRKYLLLMCFKCLLCRQVSDLVQGRAVIDGLKNL